MWGLGHLQKPLLEQNSPLASIAKPHQQARSARFCKSIASGVHNHISTDESLLLPMYQCCAWPYMAKLGVSYSNSPATYIDTTWADTGSCCALLDRCTPCVRLNRTAKVSERPATSSMQLQSLRPAALLDSCTATHSHSL